MKYDFSSTHIDVPEPLAGEILEWGKKKITDDDIFVCQADSGAGFGREDEMHVTVLYGIHSAASEQVVKVIKGQKPIKVQIGKVEVFTNPSKFDVVVLDVISPDLRDLNHRVSKEVEYTNKYGEYRPHVTIAYVKKGKGWRHRGSTMWEGRTFETDKLIFSSVNGTKERISF